MQFCLTEEDEKKLLACLIHTNRPREKQFSMHQVHCVQGYTSNNAKTSHGPVKYEDISFE